MPQTQIPLASHYLRVQLARRLERNLAGPMVAFVEVTKKCNLRCGTCDLWRVEVGPHDEMTTEDLRELARDLGRIGCRYVALFGGEATLRPDLFVMIEDLKRQGLHVTLDTNGYLLPQLYARVIATGVDMLVVSLDGSRAETHDRVRGVPGGFARAVDGLRRMQSRDHAIKLVVNTVIVRPNYRELLEVMRQGQELGVRHFRFLAFNLIPPYDLCGMQERELALAGAEIDELAERIEEVIAFAGTNGLTLNSHEFLRGIPAFYRHQHPKVRCFAGYASVHVHAEGRVSFCSSLEAGIGNVREKPLREIWGSTRFLARRREMMSDPCDKCYVSCYIEQNHWFDPGYVARKLTGRE